MRVIITEYKRMFYEKKLVTLLVITLVYIIICSSFRWLRYRLDYPYEELHYQLSAFYLWQMKYLLGISGAGIDADSQVEKPMRLQVKE